MIKPKEITPQSAKRSNVKRTVTIRTYNLDAFGALTKPIRFVQERLGAEMKFCCCTKGQAMMHLIRN